MRLFVLALGYARGCKMPVLTCKSHCKEQTLLIVLGFFTGDIWYCRTVLRYAMISRLAWTEEVQKHRGKLIIHERKSQHRLVGNNGACGYSTA